MQSKYRLENSEQSCSDFPLPFLAASNWATLNRSQYCHCLVEIKSIFIERHWAFGSFVAEIWAVLHEAVPVDKVSIVSYSFTCRAVPMWGIQPASTWFSAFCTTGKASSSIILAFPVPQTLGINTLTKTRLSGGPKAPAAACAVVFVSCPFYWWCLRNRLLFPSGHPRCPD